MRPLAPALLFCLLPALACTDTGLEEVVIEGLETFEQQGAERADVLLVIDNSLSMADEQEELSRHFRAFAQSFLQADTDFHLGVVTTDDRHDGRLRGDPYFITPTTADGDAIFRQTVQVGTGGSGDEKGFRNAFRAFAIDNQQGPNVGFFREDATLTVIFVSDEDDHSGGHPADYLDRFQELKGEQPELFTAMGLIGVDRTGQPRDCGGEFPEGARAGVRYHELIRVTRGFSGSICDGDFEPIVERMGLVASQMLDRFELADVPEEGSAAVKLRVPQTPSWTGEQLVVPPEGLDGDWPWTIEYGEDEEGRTTATLVFTDLRSLPPPSSRIEVGYIVD